MKKIALTGNIGSGKSYVSNCIKQYGVFVLDMDEVARTIRKQKKNEILAMFSLVDEKEIADIVFQDAQKREQLESFLYPLMIEVMHSFFKQYENEKICVVEVPLLFEKKWEQYFDQVWCVYTKLEVALKRLETSRHMSKEEALVRMHSQMNAEEKSVKSDFVLYNNEDDDLCKQIAIKMKEEGYYVKD